METLITYSGYRLTKSELNNEQYNLIVKSLTVTPYVNSEFGRKPKPFPIFQQDKDYIYVPREWGIQNFGHPKNVIFNPLSKINIEFKGNLRSYQKHIQDKMNCIFSKNYGGGIVCIPPGGGKTVIAIHHMCTMKLKTLIVVHKSFLLDQWKERLQQYSNASIGLIRQNICDIENRDVCIGMLQTLLSRNYTEELQQFGLIVFDECHHLSAECFSQVLKLTQVPYILGLSATPEREDKLEKVFYWHIGNIIHRSEEKQNKHALIKTYYYQTQHDKFIIELNKYNKKINMAKMITNITEIEERNESIVNIIKDILSEESNRKIFILTNRRNHIDTLNNLIRNNIDDVSLGIYIGGMKKEDLKISEEKQIILGTYEMASEGLDIQDLDTLILATPKSNIIQSIGRIMRKEIHEYNSIPLVIDIVDRLDIFYGMYNKRKKIYKKNNFNIKTFNINKNIIENNKTTNEETDNNDVNDECLFD